MNLPFTAYRRTDCQWNMERPHLHGEVELLFPLTDGDSIFIDSVSYPLRRGELFVMDAGVPHRSRAHSRQEYHRCILHFPPETARALGVTDLSRLLSAKGCRAALNEEEVHLCRRLFDRLTSEADTQADVLRRAAAFAELLALVVEKWSSSQEQDIPIPTDGTIAGLIAYIRAHLTEPLTLDLLAERAALSKSSLSHRFKSATGFSVTEYIIHCRVQQARILLSHGRSVQQSGEAAGFGDNSHFIRTFHRITGQTPGQYAKEQR